jgi:glycosyltransferase involved in cell wall biosynthesis
MPLVSVIVTTYNRRDLLTNTIDSILNQTYKNFELIVVDNCSDYDFLSHIKSFNDERIRPFQNANDGIIAVNRNFGIKKAKGDYIAFCDDDDLWEKNKLEKQLDIIKNNNAGLCFCNHYKIDQNGNIIGAGKVKNKYKNPTFTNFFLSGGYIMNSSVIIKSQCIDDVGYQNESTEMVAIEDSEYWGRILSIYKGCFLPEKLVRYRVHQGSIQNKTNNSYLNEQLIFCRVLSQSVDIPIIIKIIKIIKIYIQNLFKYLF